MIGNRVIGESYVAAIIEHCRVGSGSGNSAGTSSVPIAQRPYLRRHRRLIVAGEYTAFDSDIAGAMTDECSSRNITRQLSRIVNCGSYSAGDGDVARYL